MNLFGRLLGRGREPSAADGRYLHAMSLTEEVTVKMRETAASNDPVRALMADLWAQHHNVPFMTTVYEAVQEMKSATDQRPEGGR